MKTNEKSSKAWLVTVVLAALGLIGAEVVLYLSYYYTPVQITPGTLWVVTPDGGAPINLYESYRIFFIHLPSAYTTALCCTVCLVGGVMWLLTRKEKWEALTTAAAETGLFVGAIVLLTGTLWADYAWGSGRIGSGWNWEPRLTTMLILWLAFAALLVLRKSMDTPRQRSVMTAVYGILLGPMYPLVSKAVELGRTSHPRSFSDLLSAPEIATTKYLASIAVTIALASLVALRYQMNRLNQQIEQERAA
ncbi:MAG: cytochrome c biogenesis protein CcsA [Planctomycetes bacterium]|nr:cytochrome c biogenesis protein CcsA [Planctomycetota bacterium]